jgi:NADH-quinone oxidoreductase subunit J
LIITFCNAAFILFFFNIEFLGLIFIIIYVGAIAVLFLFVIMMLNIKSQERLFYKTSVITSIFLPSSISYITFLFLCYVLQTTFSNENFFLLTNTYNPVLFLDGFNNIDILGQTLFNYMGVCFLVAGLILLVALVGSIILTLKFVNVTKGQNVSKQLARSNNIMIFSENCVG